MKNRRTLLGILVLTVAITFLGNAQFSYGQPPKPGVPSPKPKDVAIWKITKMAANPSCYKKPAKDAPDFIYEVRVEFKATRAALSPGDLVIEAKYVSNYETTTKPPLNLTDATRTWALGTAGTIAWGADTIKVTKVTQSHFILVKPDAHVSWKVDGVTPLKITGIAHTYVGTVKRSTDTKLLTINPCK